MAKQDLLYLIIHGNTGFHTEILRETKTLFIGENDKYKKFPAPNTKGAVASSNSICENYEVYPLDSDYAIKKLGRAILVNDHPNKDYINRRYAELQFIDEVQTRAIKKIQNCKTFDQCQNINALFHLEVVEP